ncbi:MAG: adenosylcobinamide-GDP ribazoletransferase [Candidatus Levybacteria bacterium]|nr:adenosylcobinamide-GDP ribazoletransferase [Candidatus Levybacteria bacterium]
MKTGIQYFFHSLLFFTRIPVGRFVVIDEKTLIGSRIFLPLVGVVVGGLAVLVFMTFLIYVSKVIAVLSALTFLILITGAFHEDALADSVDAFGGGSTPKDILTIMRDSRIGTYGTLALIISFAYKLFLLSTINVSIVPQLIFFSQIASRFAALPLMWKLSYVRHDSLFEKSFQTYKHTISGIGILLAFIFTISIGWLLFGQRVLELMAGVIVVIILSGIYYYKRLGGATGDCFGATINLSEMCIYFFGLFL